MKFAVCNETFQDWPFEKAFEFAHNLGYTGIEFAPFTINPNAYEITPAKREEVRRQAEDAKLEVVGLHWLLAFTEGFYLTSPEAEVRKRTSDYLCELARLCRDLGGKFLVLGSPHQRNLLPGVSEDQAMEFAAHVIRAAVDEMHNCGVTLAVEPLGPEEGDFLLTAEKGIRLIEMVDSPNCRLHLDVKAMSSEDKPITDIIRDSAEYMVHFHANDANRRGPGMGEIDFGPIFNTLQEINYQGWVSVEVFDYEPGVETLATDSIRYMQSCLGRLAVTDQGNADHYTEDKFWEKVKGVTKFAGRSVIENALRLYYACQSPKTPAWAKAVIISALGYFIFPADAIPDFIPVAGYTDDLGAMLAALGTVSLYITDEVKALARKKVDEWFGKSNE